MPLSQMSSFSFPSGAGKKTVVHANLPVFPQSYLGAIISFIRQTPLSSLHRNFPQLDGLTLTRFAQ